MSHGSVLIGTSEIRSQAQESGRYTPDPFPRERVGSGDETTARSYTRARTYKRDKRVKVACAMTRAIRSYIKLLCGPLPLLRTAPRQGCASMRHCLVAGREGRGTRLISGLSFYKSSEQTFLVPFQTLASLK